MAWKETRGSARVVVASARQVAHSEDAKQRSDETSRAPRSVRGRVLVGAGAAVLVLALIAFLTLRGDDSATNAAAVATPRPTPSATPTEPSQADVLSGSVPTGTWRLTIGHGKLTTRGGGTHAISHHETNKWSFPAVACTDEKCSGTVSSTSGNSFPFTWNGKKLSVDRGNTVERDKKAACVDTVTGQVKPIELSAARLTYHYHYPPFTGSSERMTSLVSTKVTYEFFGDCHPADDDTVSYTYLWTLVPLPTNS